MRRPLAAAIAAASTALLLPGAVAPAATAATTETLVVDFGESTGAFRGGATGTLYGFGDDGAPTRALVNGARITNSSQKAPYGTQHPSGDALKIEDTFFDKHGEDLYIYVQDYYPDWPYYGGVRPGDTRGYDQETGEYANGANGTWDYLEVVELVAEAVAAQSSHPQDYVFIPFNEPDGIWYQNWGSMKDQFMLDWTQVHAKIQEVYVRHGLGQAVIAGPGDSRWQPQRSRDFLEHAKETDTLPEIFVWHELGIDNLAQYRANFAAYRALEKSVGIDPLEINITEYGMLRDMGVPGQLVQWFAMFEDTKVDAQTAYWNYAGNFSDNSARANGANGGWWMFKWYGDLAGSETVRVTPPQLNAVDTLQGIGALDVSASRGTVLLGGGSTETVHAVLHNLPAETFGDAVDIEVREIQLTGAEGVHNTPRVVASQREVVRTAEVVVDVPVKDRYSAYQLVVTPSSGIASEGTPGEANSVQAWETVVEAEELTLSSAQSYIQNPTDGGGWKFLASGGRDVGSFNRVTSRADWSVEVPRDGTYRLQVVGGAPGVPGRHALFVDGASAGLIQYTADLALNDRSRWQYRGSAEVLVDLTAGSHVLSIRASADGSTVLPNSDITMDKLVLTDVTDGEPTQYRAALARTTGGAAPVWAGERPGAVQIGTDQSLEVYASAMDHGYYDVVVRYHSPAEGSISLALNGRVVAEMSAPRAGNWESTARLYLSEGINEIELLGGVQPVLIEHVETTRVRAADSAATVIEGEAGTRGGAVEVVTLADSTGTNASGSAYAGNVGGAAANTLTFERSEGFDTPGDYELIVHFSNAELSGAHDYNPQVVDRRLDVAEGATAVGSAHFRYTYSWNSFQNRTIPISLATAEAPLVLGNAEAFAPNIDRLTIAPTILGEVTTTELADDREEIVFTDVIQGQTPFYDEIMWLASQGVATGWLLEDGSREFRPVGHVTRDAMAAFLYRLAGEPASSVPDRSPFVDVTIDSPFYAEIAWLANTGISTGWREADGATYRPYLNITRDAMAAFLYRFADSQLGVAVEEFTPPAISPFADVAPSNGFYTEIAWLADAGVSTGWQVGQVAQFRPYHHITRDAMAAFMYRLDNM